MRAILRRQLYSLSYRGLEDVGRAIGNHIPAPAMRGYGSRCIKRFLERWNHTTKTSGPEGLIIYVNDPTLKSLALPFLHLRYFNVYLDVRNRIEAYLTRLYHLAGDWPLVLGEGGCTEAFRI